ncbi:MAG: hypothetical protein EOP56_03365 [Sphingobacteriales bacterium]|nr:MAG: hypothetical protein EOP56_03365 [Sphingobacteriales bacterium]
MTADAFMVMVSERVAASFTSSKQEGRLVCYDLVRDRGMAVVPSDPSVIVSTTNYVFPLHTDSCCLEKPADVVVLYCVTNASEGGESLLANVNDIIPLLPEDYVDFLLNRRYDINMRPFVLLEKVEGTYHIRLQLGDMLAFCRPDEKEQMQEELKMLIDVLADPANFITVKLKPDECLIVNNRTCLHGRYSFEDGSKREFLRSRSYLIPDIN